MFIFCFFFCLLELGQQIVLQIFSSGILFNIFYIPFRNVYHFAISKYRSHFVCIVVTRRYLYEVLERAQSALHCIYTENPLKLVNAIPASVRFHFRCATIEIITLLANKLLYNWFGNGIIYLPNPPK